jgi:outer membrane protein OmpA-like peptidoglycan-associated protein
VIYSKSLSKEILAALFSLFIFSGCVATQDWVQTWVNEQLFPINKRVSETEAGLSKVDARVDVMAKQVAELENRLNQTNAKADRALESLQRLRPERKLVLNYAGGAMFASNSISFSGQAKKDIDSFLSDAKGYSDDNGSLVFVVAGHADSLGSESANYDLSRRRAESIATYLTTEKHIDPARVVTVAYGEKAPAADNKTEAGRAKNRRVEILVYRDSIGVGPAGSARADAKAQ